MSEFGRCFLPGPTDVRPEIYAVTSEPMFFHRSPRMVALLKDIQPSLQKMFGTAQPVFTATSSATGLMETAVRNGVRQRVAVITGGFFGEMFARVAASCGKEVVRIGVPYGETIEPEQLHAGLEGIEVDAVALVHSESGTGALAPLAELAPVIKQRPDALLLVDAVTAAGATPVEMDRWGVDFIFTGSQKALALPPGIAIGSASEAFLNRARSIEARGYYFDALTFVEEAKTGLLTHTCAIPLYKALERQLSDIDATGGWEGRWSRHAAMLKALEDWVAARPQTSLLARAGRRSPALSAIRLGPGIDPQRIVALLLERGYQIGTGLGSLASEIIRIGHMGDLEVSHVQRLLSEIDNLIAHYA